MNDNFENKDFEQFVKQNADQYRMFPSEKVWKSIHYTLHTRRRWYGLGLIVLFITAGIVTWVMLSPSLKNNQSLSYQPEVASQTTPAARKPDRPPVLIAAEKQDGNKSRFITSSENLEQSLFRTTPEKILNDENTRDRNTVAPELAGRNEPLMHPAISVPVELPAKVSVVHSKPVTTRNPAEKNITIQEKSSIPLVSEDEKPAAILSATNPETEKRDMYPMTIESVVNSYQRKHKVRKISWEVFVTPTISYRKLTENKAFINSAQANNNLYNYTSVADINSLVTHRPDMGIQFGLNAGYPVTKSLKIIGGLQFNVSKYDIRASFSSGEVATIALNTGAGTNSVSTFSNYRNSNSTKADWLRNLYFSASVPVGLELKLSGNNKKEFGVRGTIQPTYILSDRAFLLSTDYKNYVEVPSLTRRWNMNTSFEIFAAYSTGKINWRIGPQVRYQLKSSFKAKYPVKEHLYDFGLKLGLMLNK